MSIIRIFDTHLIKNLLFVARLTPTVDIATRGISTYFMVDKTNNSQPILRYEVRHLMIEIRHLILTFKINSLNLTQIFL